MILDISTLILVGIFLIGLGITEYEAWGLQEPLFDIPTEWKSFFEFLIWPLIVLLMVDITLKYNKIRDPKKFLKTHWIDITMLALIPIFSAFKFFKLGINIIKKLKSLKMGVKVAHKTRRMMQR